MIVANLPLQTYARLKPLTLFFLVFFFAFKKGICQSFDPPAGQMGSLALAHEHPEIQGWASRIKEAVRGPKNITRPEAGPAVSGNPENALGAALQNGTFSLGDGGYLTLGFDAPVFNGPGPDFAVFENGFSDGFLELAMVEVSSNGVDFFAFPPVSETPGNRQVGPFDTLDARCLNNLAGKYRAGFGTCFDLEELSGIAGLDVSLVHWIRVRDVVGSLLPAYATADSKGNPINDPWPTDFESSGFDLDAVATLHVQAGFLVWPTVLERGGSFHYVEENGSAVFLITAMGQPVARFPAGESGNTRIPASLTEGVYFLRLEGRRYHRKILVQ